MKFLNILITCLISTLFLQEVKAQYVPHSQDTDDLSIIFLNYQSSVMSNNVAVMISYIDTSTIKQFKEIFYNLKNSDSTELITKDYSTIAAVMYARFMAPEGAISKMNNIFDFLNFYNKINLQADITQQKVIDIKIDNDIARVYTTLIGYEGADMKTYYFIKYGDGDWKISYNHAFKEFNENIESDMKNYGVHSKETMINSFIATQNYNAMGRNVWHIVK
ncbi:MAG: hypothetical protein M9887_01760 [Chitinophagales bacterium]|nr:hypothetical protein [Chitinophagales bacterium]